LRFGELRVKTDAEHLAFEAEVFLNGLDPNAVRVELYADGASGAALVRQELERVNQSVDASQGYAYRAQVPAARPATDYTARLIPNYTGVAVPLEATRILWQR